MKRKYLLIFIPVAILALVAVVYFVVSNLGRQQTQTPRIQRIFDIPEVKEQLKSGLFAPTYLEDFRLLNKTRKSLTPSGEFGKSKVLYYKLHEDYQPITWETNFITPPALRSGEETVGQADNLEQVLSGEEPCWCYSEPQEINLDTQILPGREITKVVRIPFKETRIELLIKLTKATKPIQKPRILINLNCQLLAEVVLRRKEEIITVNTFKLSPEPGECVIGVKSLNDNTDKQRPSIFPVVLSQIRIGPPRNGILIKYPEEKRKRIRLDKLFISYPAVNHEQKILFDEMEKSNRLFGRAFQPEGNPVIPVRLKDEGGRYETVRATAILSNSGIKANVIVGMDSILEFKYGYYSSLGPPGQCSLNIRITDAAGSRAIYSNTLALTGIEPGRWHRARLPLDQTPEGIGVLEFSLNGPDTETFACLLGEPTVLTSSEPDELTPPNIILISLDTLRADHLGCYGYHRQTSPTIDSIAAEGVLFRNAFAQAGFTLPSHKSMLTGYYPLSLEYLAKSITSNMRRLPPAVPTFASYMKEAGYYCAAFTNSGYLGSTLGFYKDFDFYNEFPVIVSQQENGEREVKPVGFDKAYDWLKEHEGNAPFFLFLHTLSIHTPYAAPQEYDHLFKPEIKSTLPITISRKILNEYSRNAQTPGNKIPAEDLEAIIAAYDRGIRWTDDEIKKLYALLESLSLLDNTILIITSDHGEEFMEHNGFLHSTMYEELLRVPLIVRFPKRFIDGVVIDTAVELVDLLPTILDALEKRPRYPLPVRSILSLLEGRAEKLEQRPRFGSRPRRVIVSHNNYKLIMNTVKGEAVFELYNLSIDPSEKINIYNNQTENSEVKNVAMRMLLYYIANNYAGVNIAIESEDQDIIFKLNISGVKLRGGYGYNKKSLYSTKAGPLRIILNETDLTIRDYPTLVSLEGRAEGKAIKVEFSGDPAREGSRNPFEKMRIGLHRDLELSSPLILTDSSDIYRSISFHNDLKLFMSDKADAYIWYTGFGWEWADDEAVEAQPDDLVEQLKQLGYIQ